MNAFSHTQPALPRRGPACPSALALEQFAANEATALTATQRAHTETCADCAGYLRELRAFQAEFFAKQPEALFAAKLTRRLDAQASKRPWWRQAFGPALAAAAVLGLVVWLSSRPTPSPDVIEKGATRFTAVFRREGTEAQALSSRSLLRTGDQLRFGYRAPREGHLVVLNRDGRGAVSSFVPLGAGAPVRVAPSERLITLPGTVVLDAAPGPQWLVAVFSESELNLDALIAQLKEAPADHEPAVSCAGCAVDVLRFDKETER